jgi:hypothetical protein
MAKHLMKGYGVNLVNQVNLVQIVVDPPPDVATG